MHLIGTIGDIYEMEKNSEKLIVEWHIVNFYSLSNEIGEYYDSPDFYFNNACWCLSMDPNGVTLYDTLLDLFLQRRDSGPPMTIQFTLSIQGEEGVEKRLKEKHKFSENKWFWGFHFLPRQFLTDHQSILMPNNKLIIRCIMTNIVLDCAEKVNILQKSVQNMQKSEEGGEHTLKEQGMEELKESLRRLLICKKDSDVVIKVKDKNFPAHRLLLQARSPVFEAMFSHDMLEKLKGVVTMEDLDQESFPDFLEHLYTGSVEMISTGNVFSLYTASDKYDLKTLKKACREFVKKNLTIVSIWDTIKLAIKHNEKELIELATEFFCNNSLEICKTVEWQIFLKENMTVGNELIIKAFSK